MSDFKAKCTKFGFRWGSVPDLAGGAYSAPPHPLAVFKGPTSKGREEERKRGFIDACGTHCSWCSTHTVLSAHVFAVELARRA